ncbi:hypothetical protein CB1_000345009 [Camelus ferus]|nr:hypothetical protein CB1_000345009 [Camelus ferus]
MHMKMLLFDGTETHYHAWRRHHDDQKGFIFKTRVCSALTLSQGGAWLRHVDRLSVVVMGSPVTAETRFQIKPNALDLSLRRPPVSTDSSCRCGDSFDVSVPAFVRVLPRPGLRFQTCAPRTRAESARGPGRPGPHALSRLRFGRTGDRSLRLQKDRGPVHVFQYPQSRSEIASFEVSPGQEAKSEEGSEDPENHQTFWVNTET